MGKKSQSIKTILGHVIPMNECNFLEQIDRAVAIPTEGCTPEKLALVNSKMLRWRIKLLWVAYEMYPVVDINHNPYRKPGMAALKHEGEELFLWLELIKGCWESDGNFSAKYRHTHGSPIGLWTALCIELKLFDITSILQPTSSRSPAKDYKKYKQDAVRTLLAGGVKSTGPDLTPIANSTLRTAHRLQSKKPRKGKVNFKVRYWQPFLDILRTQSEAPPYRQGAICLNAEGKITKFQGRKKTLVKLKPKTNNRPILAKVSSLSEEGQVLTLAIREPNPLRAEEVYRKKSDFKSTRYK